MMVTTAFAQAETSTSGPLVSLLTSVLPVFLILGLLFFLFRRTIGKQRPYQLRAQEHMDRMEQKYDRIIELLEKLVEKMK